ncbi:unnamed protein product [Caenorhabditis nigoni]
MTTEATTEVTTAAGAGCGMCDINAIAPDLPDPETSFDTLPRDPVDGCQQIYVQCSREDDKFCDPVTMTATNADGTHDVAADSTQATSQTTLLCGDDGLYSYMGITGITQLHCSFTNCG